MVTVLEDTRHNLESGDRVSLSEITGTGRIGQLNGKEFDIVVKNNDPFNFFILSESGTDDVGIFERGGYVNQIKKPVTISFKSFTESLLDPQEIVSDFMKIDRTLPLHVAFYALKQYDDI